MIKYALSIIFYTLGGVVFVLSALVYLTVAIFIHPRNLYPLTRIISRVFLLASGQWVIIEGSIPKTSGPYLYMFNHQSMFDGFLLQGSFRHYVTGVGAEKQFKWFIWGRIVKRFGVIPIKRSNLKKAIHSLDAMEDVIRNGTSCMISPEGTRTLTGEMSPFKKGPFHVALHTHATIIPIGLIGAYEAKPKNRKTIRPGLIRVVYGDPMPFESYKDFSVEELRDTVKEKISKLSHS